MHCRHANSSAISCLKAGQSAQLLSTSEYRMENFSARQSALKHCAHHCPATRGGDGAAAHRLVKERFGDGSWQRNLHKVHRNSAPALSAQKKAWPWMEQDNSSAGCLTCVRRCQDGSPRAHPSPRAGLTRAMSSLSGKPTSSGTGSPLLVACPKRLASPSMEI